MSYPNWIPGDFRQHNALKQEDFLSLTLAIVAMVNVTRKIKQNSWED
jgi:hypothetical protein